MGAWVSKDAEAEQGASGPSVKRVRELEQELEEQQQKARKLEDDWKKASQALSTVSVKLATATETIIRQATRLEQLEGVQDHPSVAAEMAPAGDDVALNAPPTPSEADVSSDDSLAEAKPKKGKGGRPKKNPIPVKKVIKKATPKVTPPKPLKTNTPKVAASKTPAAGAAMTPGTKTRGRPSKLQLEEMGLTVSSEHPQRPLNLLLASDVKPSLVKRYGERFWEADQKWYVFRLERLEGKEAVLKYATGEVEVVTLAGVIQKGHLSLIE